MGLDGITGCGNQMDWNKEKMKKTLTIIFVLLMICGAGATDRYVSLNGGHVTNFTTWATAATNIQDAISVCSADDVIFVSNGVYEVGQVVAGGTNARVAITNAITVRSLNNDPTNTVIKGGSGVRGVYMVSGAQLIGFTVRDAAFNAYGVGIRGGIVSNCIVSSNTASGPINVGGGGAYLSTLYNCLLTSNSAYAGAGAYDCKLYDCVLTANSASYAGGGVAGADYANSFASNCMIYNNTAGTAGGGACDCKLYNCKVFSNSASEGGGIYAWNVAGIYNCVISSNSATAGNGGGVHAGRYYNCTIVSNSATGEGGGAWHCTLYNSISWNNNKADHGVTESYSCGVNYIGAGSINSDPLFVDGGNFRLQSGSPCINAGSNSLAPTNITPYDLDGNQRIINDRVDMGAYESSYVTVPATPAGLAASEGTYTDKVLLTWNTALGATGYQIWRHTISNSAGADQIGSTVATTYDDTGAAAGTTYYYWVKATNAAGASGFSASDAGYLGSSVATLDAPTGLSASDGTYSNKVRVMWNAVTDAVYYELWRNTSNSSASASVLAQTTNSVTYDDATVTAGASYCYWVKAKNAQTTSAFSDPDSGYAALSVVSGYANLEVSDVILLPTTLSVGGHPGTAGIQLMNWGPNDLTTPNTRVLLEFFLSKNTTFGDADDLWLGDYQTDVTLSSGSYTLVAVTTSAREGFTVPSGAVGTNYVFARARHTYPSTLGDSDESNNHAMRAGTITVTGSDDTPSAGYHLVNDYDGDGKSDLALYKEVTGEWLVMLSGDSYVPIQFVLGRKDYRPVIADYDGDGKADPAVCNQKTGEWKALLSDSSNSLTTFSFGGHTDMPVPIDYDRDGKADPAIYRQSGDWVMLLSGSSYVEQTMMLGGNTYMPVPADYDGDGISDLAVYRSSTGDWMLKMSTLDYWTMEFEFGGSGAIPVPADYDGDGKADIAVYKESSGDWSVIMSRFNYLTAGATFGGHGWVPVAADYDGDGKEDVAIYNDDQRLLKVLMSGSNYEQITLDIGGPGYEPLGWPR